MKKLLLVVLAVPALLLVLVLLGISFLVLSLVPPVVAWVAAGLMVVFVVWFIVGRRGASAGPLSEGSLMGRQTSKDGLL